MQTTESFKNYFLTDVTPQLNRLEKQRKVGRTVILIAIALILIIGVHATLFFWQHIDILSLFEEKDQETIIAYHAIPVIIVIVILVVYLKFTPYKKNYKEQLIRPVVNYISSDFQYDPKQHISSRHIRDSKTIISKFNRLKGDDLVTGQIHGHPFELSEIKAEYKTKHKKDNKTKTVFHGLFFHSEIKNKFDGYVLLQPYIPRILQGLRGRAVDSDVVNLSDMTISEKFVCYSNDDINARKILTPKLIERVNHFSDHYKKRSLAISIIENKIYVAIDYRKNLFEPKYFSSVKDPKHPVDYYEMIVIITGILEQLDLAEASNE